MNREEYRRFRWMASICISVFIVCFGIVLLAFNRWVYHASGTNTQTEDGVTFTQAEADLYYEQIADSYCSFFKGRYDVAGYTLTDTNIHQLNRLKGYYRLAWILSILSFAGIIYSFRRLWRRRETMPCFYGSAGGALLAAVLLLRIVFSKREVMRGLKDMIFKQDYSYFQSGDLLCRLLSGAYARNMLLMYLGIVAAEIAVFVLIRVIIRFAGRPHRF